MSLCEDNVCPCDEAGICAAIRAGGDDPYTFDCDGPTKVATEDEIVIDNDVILDGEGNLSVDANHPQRVFSVPKGVNAELHRLTATHEFRQEGGGVANEGTLTIHDCVISHNQPPGLRWLEEERGGGIRNAGQMTIINSTISENYADHTVGGGIYNGGEVTIINSTVSGNDVFDVVSGFGLGGGIANAGWMSVTNSTVSGNRADSGDATALTSSSYTEIANTLIDGDCGVFDMFSQPGTPDIASNGYNIESPGDTCGFDEPTDQPNVSALQLNLGPLADNGGPTMTRAFAGGSVAINHIPAFDCELDEDQRGVSRPQGDACDVGAVEIEVTP